MYKLIIVLFLPINYISYVPMWFKIELGIYADIHIILNTTTQTSIKLAGKRVNISFLIGVFFMMNTVLASAFPDYYFKHYNINNGLSQNTVYSIFQDKQGFMWFGTKDGLNRFDGTTFKTFRFPPDGDLRDNLFKRILQDENDNLWVATDDGACIYNPKEERFTRFEKQTDTGKSVVGTVSDMILDETGDVWMSVEDVGVFQYNVSEDKLIFHDVPVFKDGMKILTLCAGKNNDVWVFPYSRPFFRIDKKSGEITEFNLQDDSDLLWSVGEISAVLSDKYNDLILATSQKGVLSINTANGTHRVLLEKDQSNEPIFARSIIRVDEETLWIGTESGIYIYDTENGTIKNLKHFNYIPHTLSDNAVYSIYKDRENGIWAGTYFGGVNYFANSLSKMEVFYAIENINSISGNRVREFCSAADGNIWIGTEDKGLNLFNPKSGEFLPVPPELKNLYTNIHALYNDGNYFWISTFSKGLYRYNLQNRDLRVYTQFDKPETINQNSVFALCKDRQNTLWIGTLSGINTYDEQSDSFSNIEELTGISIQDIIEDTDGNIWVATFHSGLYRYNPLTKEWIHYENNPDNPESLPYNKTTSIFQDSKNRLWIATEGGGFSLFNKKEETFYTINNKKGLANNVVYQIQEDDEGFLWLSTNSGIVRFSPETESFKNYRIESGLKTNQFNYKSSYKDVDGTLYFGSVDGFVRFRPADFNQMDDIPPFVFTDLQINNYPANKSVEDSPLTESIQYTEKISLPHKKNSIGLQYAVLSFSGFNTRSVIHKLEGVDKEWIKGGSNHSISYSNLSPGKYRLMVAFDNEDGTNEHEVIKTLLIRIRPPFWKTWWAYIIYVLSVAGFIWGGVWIIHRNSEKDQQRKMRLFEQEKERELYKSKIDFFTNVAHEIRTPLSLIKAPLDQVLSEKKLPSEVRENLVIMDKNTERLLNLTNQLLDFRKTESDLYTIDLKVHNISNLVKETVSRFTSFAKQQNIAIELHCPENDLLAQVDREAFIKIISNLINNAIKYGETFVRFRLIPHNESEDNAYFEFLTENDGEIVPAKYEKEIFKTFIHLDANREKNINGTGIGLALTKSLTELLKGSVTYENDGGVNTFRLLLPIGAVDSKQEDTTYADAVVEDEADSDALRSKAAPVVLLVEDDVEMSSFISKCLVGSYSTLSAQNGKEALNILKNKTVNLVVSDVMMPEMDGFELTKEIKSDIEISHIPVILLTAKTTNQAKIKGYEMGADGYIEKPFSVEVLLARIAGLLQNRENLRETFMKNPIIGATTMAITKSDEKFIKKLNEVVSENLSNPDFNVEDIAGEFNMSRASFYRKIKGVLDLTPNEYIRVERLKKAAILLKEDNYKINEICYMVGFNSPSYFSKCFQQQFGVLPKDFI